MEQLDITCRLISESTIRTNLTTIFSDAIIVDNNFFITAVSDSITKMTGLENAESHPAKSAVIL